MLQSGTEIVVALHSPGLDLINQQSLLDTIVTSLHETFHRNQFRTL